MSNNFSLNQREVPNVKDSISGVPFPLKGNSSDGSLNVNVTSIGGSGLTVSGSKSNNAGAPGATNLGVLPAIANAAAPSYTEGNQVGLSTDLSGALRVSGSISVGGTTDNSAFTAGSSQGTPAMGFYHSTIDTVTDGRAAAVAITPKRAMMVNLQTAAGVETGVAAAPLQVSLANTAANATAVKVDGTGGTFPISGTVTTSPPSNASTNIAQINAVTPLMGNGLTGTGSLRVTIASDNTAFAVNSTLSAETTKVIGTVNIAAAQTIAVTNTGTFATQATLSAETTKVIGTVNVAASQTIAVTQATAASLNATVVGTGTFAVQNTPVAPATIFNGKTSTVTAGSRVTLAASQAVQSVTIKALITNTGIIYVGNSTVSSANGFQLSAGETISMDVANLNTINIDSSVSGEGVTYVGIG